MSQARHGRGDGQHLSIAAATSRTATSGRSTRSARARVSRSPSTPRAATRMDPLCHFENFLQVHTCSHAPEQLIACTAIIYSGLLEKYQDLRVAFLEAGIGWVPFWMEHMDEEYEYRAASTRRCLKTKPSEYMACGRVFVSCEPEEKTLRYVPDFFPEENILFASDYPALGRPVPECRGDARRPQRRVGRAEAQDLLRQPAAFLRAEVDRRRLSARAR